MANAKYFLKRFAMALLTIFLVACLTFLLMNAVPGSPWLSEKTPSAATLAALNAKYGLDKPVHVQLFMYLKNILHGDFGVSLKMQKNRAVLDIIVATPSSDFTFCSSAILSSPITLTVPPVRLSIFKISLIVVVLPEPFGPIKPIIYPFGKVKLIL